MRMDLKRTFLVSALLALLAFVAAPLFAAPALAQTLTADAQLYELTENMKLVGGTLVRRKATSQLMGRAAFGTPICPAWVQQVAPTATSCIVNATGSDNISLITGLGTFGGTFTVVVPGDNATDSPEYVVAKGKFHGTMNFSPAIVVLPGEQPIPLGYVVGKMVLDGGGRVPFTGIFRLPWVLPSYQYGGDGGIFGGAPLPLTPFPTKFYAGQFVTVAGAPVAICTTANPLDSCTRPLYVFDLATFISSEGAAGWAPVEAEEYGLGYPTVRFDITFQP